MILIRRLLGDVLRRKRQDEGRTLRQLAADARISPGYLSEIERGQKEPSSELLAAICDALQARLSDVLREVSIELAAAELAAQLESERISAPVPPAAVGAVSGSQNLAVGPVPVPASGLAMSPVGGPGLAVGPLGAGPVGAPHLAMASPNLLAYPVVLPGGSAVPQLALR